MILLLPFIRLVAFGFEPIIRVSRISYDENFRSREITQDDISPLCLPKGPSWPKDGVTWYEANSICKYLITDVRCLSDAPKHIWRLPTVDEAMRSMKRHGVNAKGELNTLGQQEHEIRPDKKPLYGIPIRK
ncbi:MAG: hypothetical protein MK086_00475 [Flavobacteriales bacterium]|nr:hypothetical protein [Flavobacteriales bacterium]